MGASRANPYYNYAMDRLPKTSRIDNAVADYLGYCLSKNPNLSQKMWEAIIDELVTGLGLNKPDKKLILKSTKANPGSGKHQRIVGDRSQINSVQFVNDIVYMFQLATSRGWNHVYFTKEQDAAWNNISFYQDPWWSKVCDKEKNKLEEILHASENRHVSNVLSEGTSSGGASEAEF